ncbi:hydroxyacid dehydrogenase [Actinopolymorpha alba]|uniref:hydroxyacid dehydrogenase n=1 Tax=Actinopolymorpha alba TaxID=533267 RepID=UPI000381A0E6|nr:hydroxyacid dehydrogenase [Actinopolymorpha alba]
MTSDSRARVAVLLSEATRAMVLTGEAEQRLGAVADVRQATGTPDTWDLPALLDGAEACLTGWGTPRLDAEVLQACPSLRLVAHSAGSIRNLVPQEAVGDRLIVCQAAALIADSVAELVVLQMLSSLRELHRHDQGLRNGAAWGDLRTEHPGRLLGARTVGVVGASRTGQAVIQLLRAFGATILVSDPLLSSEQADALGVELLDLDDLLRRSEVVTLHAPLLPETRNLLGARELRLMRDGALLVNSARGGLVEPDALLAELQAGRITATLDVFPSEPLPPDSEWRKVPNAIISPHTAGHTLDSHRRQGDAMVSEIVRFLRKEPLRYAVPAASVTVLA